MRQDIQDTFLSLKNSLEDTKRKIEELTKKLKDARDSGKEDIAELCEKEIAALCEKRLNIIETLHDLAGSAIENEKEVEQGVEIAKYAREEMEKIICPVKVDDPVKRVREVWRIVDNCRDESLAVNEIYDYLDILLLLARNKDFDSYLLYLEKNRIEKDRLYLPKRKQFLKVGIIESLQDMIDDKLDILTISMPPGTGKGQLASDKILTPSGFRTFGELKIGDKVISGTGKVSNVLGIFPKPKMEVYELTFNDGSKVKCSKDHIWHCQTRDDRVRHKDRYRDIELSEMLKNFRVEGDRRANYSIPYVGKIDCFEKKELKIDPYLLGVLIGDGCFTSGNFQISTPDEEILNEVKNRIDNESDISWKGKYDYIIRGNSQKILRNALSEYGLCGCHSYEKFIPKDYLYASYNDRLEVLKGLMDTDGSAEVTGTGTSYSTSSYQLAQDVCELVHSLGGYCSLNKKENCGYRNKDGEFVKCRDSYNLHIEFSANHPNPFKLTRKADRYKPKRTIWRRYIENIEYVGEEETICIYIDDPSHLYITNDYVITHNTTLSKFFISAIIGWFPTEFNLFWSHSADIARMYYDGVYDILSNNTEYTWQEIFAGLAVTNTNAKMGCLNVGKYKPFQSLQTTSTGAENAGKVRASKFLMLDDLIGKLEEALNINQLEKLWRAYSTDSRQRKIDGCKEIHIATRWSVHDVIGKLQRAYEGNNKTRTRFIAIPDIDEETGESNFDYEYDGFSKQFYEDQALLMDDISYRCLYKNQPIEREGLLYHDEDLRRYLSLPLQEPDAILAICDVKNKGTDFMFMPVMCQYGNDYYLVDCVCDDNSDFDIQYEKLSDLLVRDNVLSCEFESNTGGDRVAFEVQERVTKKGGSCTITTHPTETNKETRIIVNADWVKRNVLFRDKSLYTPKEDYGIMMNWLLCYSTVGKNNHDDVPDGLANFRLFVDGMRPQIATVEAAFNPFRSRGYY